MDETPSSLLTHYQNWLISLEQKISTNTQRSVILGWLISWLFAWHWFAFIVTSYGVLPIFLAGLLTITISCIVLVSVSSEAGWLCLWLLSATLTIFQFDHLYAADELLIFALCLIGLLGFLASTFWVVVTRWQVNQVRWFFFLLISMLLTPSLLILPVAILAVADLGMSDDTGGVLLMGSILLLLFGLVTGHSSYRRAPEHDPVSLKEYPSIFVTMTKILTKTGFYSIGFLFIAMPLVLPITSLSIQWQTDDAWQVWQQASFFPLLLSMGIGAIWTYYIELHRYLASKSIVSTLYSWPIMLCVWSAGVLAIWLEPTTSLY